MTTPNIEARYPLVELGMGIKHVYQILGDRGILPRTSSGTDSTNP